MIVPVGQDLRMVFGAAKLARDYTAGKIQCEALRAAPLNPGDAFAGSGGMYRFKHTGLAVIFDKQKRTSAGTIRKAIKNAVGKCFERGARTVLLPDFSENLISQPNWISTEKKQESISTYASIMMEAVRDCKDTVKTIRIWVWDPDALPAYIAEMQRLGAE